MFVTVEALQPFVHGPIRMKPGDPAIGQARLNPYVAQALARRNLVRILDGPPTPERGIPAPAGSEPAPQEAMTLGKSAASGGALTSSSSPAAQASRPTMSSASGPGGKAKGRGKRGAS